MNRIEAPINEFLAACHRRNIAARQMIVCAGETAESLFYIVSGSVTVFVEDEEGNEIILSYLNTGDFFGEMGLFDSEDRRSAGVRAKTACEVAEISYKEFLRFHSSNPQILFALCGQMTGRLRRTSQKVSDLVFLDVTGRIAGTLLELCREPDAMTHPDGMQIRITRQELGRIVNCSREMAGKVLKSLEDQGLIEVSGKTIVVYNTR